MGRKKLDIMSREAFSQLSLYEKNAYLQELATQFAVQHDREPIELDKEVLSRLRRYYSRRVWSDLRLDTLPDDPLNRHLRALGEAIRTQSIEADVAAVLMQETRSKHVMRAPPVDDAQLMFFVPSIYDAPIKDDVNLMDIAPFSLGKNVRNGIIQYELKDCLITVESGAETGLATVFDYDIFINMVSALADEVRRFRNEEAKGLRPTLPAKMYRPTVTQILKFCRRSSGGRQYEEVEQALLRLAKTTITVTNLSNGKRRQVDTRPLIGEYRVVSTTTTGKVDEVEITIPDWVYTSVVKNEKSLPLLTLHQDYFLISSGLGRFIYRLARKAAGKGGTARYSVREIHKRSGSAQELRKFTYDLRQLVVRTQTFPMPEFNLDLVEGKEDLILEMRKRGDAEAPLLEAKANPA